MAALRPGRLHQTQHGIQRVTAAIIRQGIALRMGQLQTQSKSGLTMLQRGDQIFADNQARVGLFGFVIAFVARVAQHFARQKTRIALQRHAAYITCMQAGQMDTSAQQHRYTRV